MSFKENKVYIGKVLWFSDKGFGAIKVDDIDGDIFVHHSNVKTNSKNYVLLNIDEIVECKVRKDDKKDKLVAYEVKPSGKDKFSFEENGKIRNKKKKNKRKKNTETFEPSHKPADMRIVYTSGQEKTYNRKIASNEVILVSDLFSKEESEGMYEKLLEEMNNTKIDDKDLWKLWHGDTHLIADDKKGWKKNCPVFNSVIERIREYFNMDIKATRFNWYKNLDQWKPYHHDAAAVKKDKMKTQNFTIGLSFGAEREVSFEHAKKRTTVSVPLTNGSCYTFSKDVNIEWRHGIPQVRDNDERKKEEYNGNLGRISIIAWGKVNMINKI